jgi:pSer/pThr/pTyr-binding forkhead associated (FHA) protein
MIAAVIVLLLRIVLVIILYSFLGWMIYTLWRDLRFNTQLIQFQKVPSLILLRPGTDDDIAETTYTISEVTIGREAGNTICLQDDTISSTHSRFIYKNKHWWIEDLSSTNGTFLNDERIVSPTILMSGDEVRVGKQIMEVKILD